MTSKASVKQKRFCVLEDHKTNISQWDHTKNTSEEDINICWTISSNEHLQFSLGFEWYNLTKRFKNLQSKNIYGCKDYTYGGINCTNKKNVKHFRL